MRAPLKEGLLHEGLHVAAFGTEAEVPAQLERLRSDVEARQAMVRRAADVVAERHAWARAADALAHVAHTALKGAGYDEAAAIYGQNTETIRK